MPIDRTLALQVLGSRFSAGELQTLCFELGVDDEELPGKTHGDKARELIRYLEHRERLDDLSAAVARLRPDIRWDANEGRHVPGTCEVPGTSGTPAVEIHDVAQIGNPLIRAWRGVSARVFHILQIGGGRIEVGDDVRPQEEHPRR
ncbi:MAG: hypothetical protein NT169_28925 [Chloroflexi bacterium]|nr:hypothetical protein [Chloroflexota bacterium]